MKNVVAPDHTRSAYHDEPDWRAVAFNVIAGADVVTCFEIAFVRLPPSVTVRVTVRVAAEPYVFDGFRTVEVDPSPKAHAHDTTPTSSVLVSVNWQVRPPQLNVKFATGAWFVGGGGGGGPSTGSTYRSRLGDPVPGLVTTFVVAAPVIAVATAAAVAVGLPCR